MGSYKMHICITETVRRKLKLSYKFTYGGILPDLIKEKTGDKTTSHCLNQKDGLPDINLAMSSLDNIQDKEVKLGYIAHLVEDLIWFRDVVPTVAIKTDDKVCFLKDNSIHSNLEFSNEMYSDYVKSGYYVSKLTKVDYSILRKELLNYASDDFEVEKIKQNTTKEFENRIGYTTFITNKILEDYVCNCVIEVTKVVKKIIGDKIWEV